MKPPNLWRFIAAAIPALAAVALTGVASSATAQDTIYLNPISKYGCAKSAPKIIRTNELRIPGTNTIRFQGGGGDYAAQGFITKEVYVRDVFGDGKELSVRAIMVPELNADPILGPINCFEVELPISTSTREINLSTILVESEATLKTGPVINSTFAPPLFIGPQPIKQLQTPFGCIGRGSTPEIMPLADLRTPGVNTIRFKYGGQQPPDFLSMVSATLEERGDQAIVRAKYAPLTFIVTGVYTGGCFDANIPLSSTTRELRMIADLYDSNSTDVNGELIGNFLSSAQTSLLLTPVTTPAPTLSFWALLALAFGASWIGFKRLQARRLNATPSTSSLALLALALGLLAPPPGRRTK